MAYSPKATNGFEFRYNKAGFPANSVLYEGTSGVTYTQGELVYLTAGAMLAVATTALVSTVDTPVVGVVAATVTCSTKSTARYVPVYDNPLNVYEVTIYGHVDTTATAGTANTVTATTGVLSTTANTYAGSVVYIYEGPGKGDKRTIASHTAANPTVITINGEWSATPTTASKFVVLSEFSSAASTDAGINVGNRKRIATSKKVSVLKQTGTDGYLAIVGVNPERLTADVMITMVDGILGGAAT